MRYPGTVIYTDGSKHHRGVACYAVVILCNDRFLCEITGACIDTAATASQMEGEAIYQAIAWVAEHPDEARPPYRLHTDHQPFVNLYNGPNWALREGKAGRTIRIGKAMGLEILYIPAHTQAHNGNKICDITCRTLRGVILQCGIDALPIATGSRIRVGKAAISFGDSSCSE